MLYIVLILSSISIVVIAFFPSLSSAFKVTVPDVAMAAGTELYLHYGWEDDDWDKVARRMENDRIVRKRTPPSSRQSWMEKQWNNVIEFMQTKTARISMRSFRYAMEMALPKGNQLQHLNHVAMRPSKVIPGLIGVILMNSFKSNL